MHFNVQLSIFWPKSKFQRLNRFGQTGQAMFGGIWQNAAGATRLAAAEEKEAGAAAVKLCMLAEMSTV